MGAAVPPPDQQAKDLESCRARQIACVEKGPMLKRALERDIDWQVRMEAARVAGDVTSEQFCYEARRDPCNWASGADVVSVCDAFGWVVPALLVAVHDASWQVGLAALEGLGRAQPMSASAIPGLRDVIAHPPPDDSNGQRMVMFAAMALEQFGAMAEPAVDVLAMRASSNELSSTRISALRALTAIGRGAHEAVPTLIALASDSDWDIRMHVALALGAIAPLVPESRRALELLAKDTNSMVAVEARAALQARH